jgi:flagellum-specific peptidoglycan hydrolase FlgJ
VIDAVKGLASLPDLAMAFGEWIAKSIAGTQSEGGGSTGGIDWKTIANTMANSFLHLPAQIDASAVAKAFADFFVGALQGAWDAATSRFKPTMSNVTTGGGSVSQLAQQSTNQPIPGQVISTGSAGGPVDNSSLESFIRTAYPSALEAANGNKTLANQLLAIALSENGSIGNGSDLGATMGFNFAGVHAQPGEESFMATDAGRPTAFKKYPSLSAGLHGFMDFLQENPRYAAALARYQQTGDVDQLTRDANAAGYSETPTWQDNIKNIRQTTVEPLTQSLSGLTQSVAGVSREMGTVTQATEDTSRGFGDLTQQTADTDRGFGTVTSATEDTEAGLGTVTQATIDTGRGMTTLSDVFGQSTSIITGGADDLASSVPRSFDLMASDSLTTVSNLGDSISTISTDAAGNVVSTFTDLAGNVVGQTAQLANGAQLSFDGLADGATTTVTDMGSTIQTVVSDAAGNVLTTVTDLNGNVVSQTATMASGVGTAVGGMSTGVVGQVGTMNTGVTGLFGTMASGAGLTIGGMNLDVVGKVLAMKDGSLQIVREMNGDLTTIVKNAAGDVVQQYTTMKTDSAGQMAELQRAAAISFAATGKSANNLQDDIKDLGGEFKNFLKDFSGGTFNFTPSPPRHAGGGSVGAYQPILVGELGPEVFMPPTAGTIVPNNRLSIGADGGRGGYDVIEIRVRNPVTDDVAERIYIRGRDISIERGTETARGSS